MASLSCKSRRFRSASQAAAVALVLCWVLAGRARAGATVDLTVTDRGTFNPTSGSHEGFVDRSAPFFPGEELLVHVTITSSESLDVRVMQVDWRSSSPELILGTDIDTVNQSIDGAPNFWFDYSTVDEFGTFPANGTRDIGGVPRDSTGGYLDFSNLFTGNLLDQPWPPSSVFLGAPGVGQIHIEEGVATRLGAMPVTLPGAEGVYTFDPLSLGSFTDLATGMLLEFGFGVEPEDPRTLWSSALLNEGIDGLILYGNGSGPVEFEVVPEPSTLTLVALVWGMALRRRRPAVCAAYAA